MKVRFNWSPSITQYEANIIGWKHLVSFWVRKPKTCIQTYGGSVLYYVRSRVRQIKFTSQNVSTNGVLTSLLATLCLFGLLDTLAAMSILSRLQRAPTAHCPRAAKRIFWYLRGTSNYAVHFSYENLGLHAYVDADYVSDPTDRNAKSGFVIKLAHAAWCIWDQKNQMRLHSQVVSPSIFPWH